jgi:hypothetical protein
VDWENDLVVVVRWIQGRAFNEFIGQVLGAIASPPSGIAPQAPRTVGGGRFSSSGAVRREPRP